MSGKIKTINNKIKQNKAHYNLDRQTANISALSSRNVSKYEFLTGKDVLPEKDLLEKAATIKRFEYSLLGKELKAQTDNEFLEIYHDKYNKFSDAKKGKLDDKYDPKELFLEGYDYSVWSENNEESIDKEESTDVPLMPPLEGDEEEVKHGKGLKILMPNKLLTRLPILLAQVKAGNNSYKLKNEIRQILYLLYQHNKITKKVCNNLMKLL